MTISINLWWLVYAAIPVSAFAWALCPRKSDRRDGDWDFTFWIPGAFRLCAAIIVSLVFLVIVLLLMR